MTSPVRIVLAKVGLDGHDRGVKVVTRALARRGLSRHLSRPVASARGGRAHRGRRRRRLAGHQPAERHAHDAGAADHRAAARRPGWITSACWSAASFPRPTCPSCSSWAWPACSAPARRWPRSSHFLRERREPDACLTTCSRGWRKRDRLALARLLTLVARGEQLDAIRAAIGPGPSATPVVAITGNAGVGKSTLVGKLAEHLREPGQDGGHPGLRSAKSAHRRRAAGRSRAHAQPAGRRGAVHSQPGGRQRTSGRGRARRPDDPRAGRSSAST